VKRKPTERRERGNPRDLFSLRSDRAFSAGRERGRIGAALPAIERGYGWGNAHRGNVHWFKSESDAGFIFNVHVIGYDPKIKESSGRLYLDVEGEKLAGGLIKAPKMSSADCHKKYG